MKRATFRIPELNTTADLVTVDGCPDVVIFADISKIESANVGRQIEGGVRTLVAEKAAVSVNLLCGLTVERA